MRKSSNKRRPVSKRGAAAKPLLTLYLDTRCNLPYGTAHGWRVGMAGSLETVVSDLAAFLMPMAVKASALARRVV
jgi:hypothetical protein